MGRQFFGRPSGRFCDGRLYIDFICEGLSISYLSPYLESSGSDFQHGVNFAVAGATALKSDGSSTFDLHTQVRQFSHFKQRSSELTSQGLDSLIPNMEFGLAIYSFDIGQNDISAAFIANHTYDQVVTTISSVIFAIRRAITTVYESGGRRFLVYNSGPSGCLPQSLALINHTKTEVDPIGCLSAYNNAVKAFNSELKDLCSRLRSELTGAAIVHVDMYSIKYDLFANHAAYGFESPFTACCGFGGGPYNYQPRMTCGTPKAEACAPGSRYVNWDGVHYTEAANELIASKIMSSEHSEPKISLQSLCHR